ncbi:MAG: DUF4810 domain-containing protein [Bdellovibrionales bacterium]
MIKYISILLLLSAAGCATQNELYYWGEYEDTIYNTYKNPGEMPIERQVEILEADFEKAKSKNKPVPPGWHAHLGLLYYDLGKLDQASREFQTEKANFPESNVMVSRFLKPKQKAKK